MSHQLEPKTAEQLRHFLDRKPSEAGGNKPFVGWWADWIANERSYARKPYSGWLHVEELMMVASEVLREQANQAT